MLYLFYDRAHLRDIKDRSVLRLFESADLDDGVFPGRVRGGTVPIPPGPSACQPSTCWDAVSIYILLVSFIHKKPAYINIMLISRFEITMIEIKIVRNKYCETSTHQV